MKTVAQCRAQLVKYDDVKLLGAFPGGEIYEGYKFGYIKKMMIVFEVEPSPLVLALLKWYGYRKAGKQNLFIIDFGYWYIYIAAKITGAEYSDEGSRERFEGTQQMSWSEPCFHDIVEWQKAKLLSTAS